MSTDTMSTDTMSSDGPLRPRIVTGSWGDGPEEMIFDERGDLQLVVDGGRKFLVCSRALARASTVFASMLYGGFAESKPLEGDWVVTLPDDTTHGFPILLEIMHGNLHEVRHDIFEHLGDGSSLADASELLCEVAITANKYDLVHIFWPWAESWLGECRQFYDEWSDSDGWRGELIWAAWVFGDEKLLLRELDQVVGCTFVGNAEHDEEDEQESNDPADHGSATPDFNGMACHELRIVDAYVQDMPLYDPKGDENEILHLLGIEQIDDTRFNGLAAMIDPVKSFHDAVLAGEWPCRYHTHWSILPKLYFQALGLVGFNRLPDAETYKETTGDLCGQLSKFRDKFDGLCDDLSLTAARCCLGQVMKHVKNAYRNSKFQLHDWQRAHLECQRQISRINGNWDLT